MIRAPIRKAIVEYYRRRQLPPLRDEWRDGMIRTVTYDDGMEIMSYSERSRLRFVDVTEELR